MAALNLCPATDRGVAPDPVASPSRLEKMTIEVDVLTKSGNLYAGRLSDKVLAAEGDLQSVTLGKPRRFRREEYLKAKEANTKPNPEDLWTVIPGELFVLVASDISTMNVRHIPAVPQFVAKYQDIREAFRKLKTRTEEQKRPHWPTNRSERPEGTRENLQLVNE